MTLGVNIKLLKESKFISILDVEEITGLSKSTINKIERDMFELTVDTLDKISHSFNMQLMSCYRISMKIIKRYKHITLSSKVGFPAIF